MACISVCGMRSNCSPSPICRKASMPLRCKPSPRKARAKSWCDLQHRHPHAAPRQQVGQRHAGRARAHNEHAIRSTCHDDLPHAFLFGGPPDCPFGGLSSECRRGRLLQAKLSADGGVGAYPSPRSDSGRQ